MARGSASGEAWELHELWHEGEPYLEDRKIGVIYAREPEAPGLYRPVGRRAPGGVGTPEGLRDKDSGCFFAQLDSYLRAHAVDLRHLFDAADATGGGTLGRSELAKLAAHVMPQVSDIRCPSHSALALSARAGLRLSWYI